MEMIRMVSAMCPAKTDVVIVHKGSASSIIKDDVCSVKVIQQVNDDHDCFLQFCAKLT